jgi:hypothetical protein
VTIASEIELDLRIKRKIALLLIVLFIDEAPFAVFVKHGLKLHVGRVDCVVRRMGGKTARYYRASRIDRYVTTENNLGAVISAGRIIATTIF